MKFLKTFITSEFHCSGSNFRSCRSVLEVCAVSVKVQIAQIQSSSYIEALLLLISLYK
jgi:hypothetical protein